MPFGPYSEEPKVKQWILRMRDEGTAFICEGAPAAKHGGNGSDGGSGAAAGQGGGYLLAGALFQKGSGEGVTDLSKALEQVLCSLRG